MRGGGADFADQIVTTVDSILWIFMLQGVAWYDSNFPPLPLAVLRRDLIPVRLCRLTRNRLMIFGGNSRVEKAFVLVSPILIGLAQVGWLLIFFLSCNPIYSNAMHPSDSGFCPLPHQFMGLNRLLHLLHFGYCLHDRDYGKSLLSPLREMRYLFVSALYQLAEITSAMLIIKSMQEYTVTDEDKNVPLDKQAYRRSQHIVAAVAVATLLDVAIIVMCVVQNFGMSVSTICSPFYSPPLILPLPSARNQTRVLLHSHLISPLPLFPRPSPGRK